MELFYIMDSLLRCFPDPVRWLIGIVVAIALVTTIAKLLALIMEIIPVL